MFNRRHLRIKAIQAVYNYSQKERVAYQLGLDELDEFFAPDLNSMESPNIPLLKKNKKLATKIYQQQYKQKALDISEEEVVKDGVISAKTVYINYLKEEKKNIQDYLEKDLNNVWHNYISVIKILEDLSKHIAFLYENNENKRMKAVLDKADYKLGFSKIFDKVRESDEYVSYINKHQFLWEDDNSIIKNFYRETLVHDERYKTYLTEESSEENDAALLVNICKRMLWKNAQITEFFEEQDAFWDENHEIVSGLLMKSFKILKNEGKFELIHLSPNWEDDKEYLFNLLDKGIEFPEELSLKIKDKLKNWELERLSSVDRHILEVALIEMIEYPSIPVKVTINEFLEVTKKYSQPKSKQFINGVLDSLSKELLEEKVIRKTGRGLIDNK